MKIRLLAAALIAASAWTAFPAANAAEIIVREAPPPLRIETVPAPRPGYVWGAGHAAELAYLFPSFDNGTPIAPTFNAAERRLARDMKAAWAGFAFRGTPGWPSYSRSRVFYSLRAGGDSRVISDAAFAAEHQCGYWDSVA